MPKLQARSADGWELLGHDRAHGAIVYIQTQASKRDFLSCKYTEYILGNKNADLKKIQAKFDRKYRTLIPEMKLPQEFYMKGYH